MGLVQSQKEKGKKAESGEKTGFKSEVILIASLLSRRNLISYTDFYAQRRDCLFSTESETNDNPTGDFPGAGGRAAVELLLHASQALLLQPRSRERGWCGGGRRWGPGKAQG